MYYIKEIIITSEGNNEEKVVSRLPLEPGLNIVCGPSNTGKTHVLDCVDFLLGGDARRLYKKELKIIGVSLRIDVDGAEISMYRELAEETKSDIVVSSGVEGIHSGTYTANNQPTKEKDTIGSLWLRLMGIDDEVKIIKQIEDAQWQRLTARTFYHMFVINENRISGENSILKSGTTWTKNIPVSARLQQIESLLLSKPSDLSHLMIAEITSRRVRFCLAKDVPDSGQEHPADRDYSFFVTTTCFESAIAFSELRMMLGFDQSVGNLN